MFYKKEEYSYINNDKEEIQVVNWLKGNIVDIPFEDGEKDEDGNIKITKLTVDNKQSLNGWEWHDTAPQDYIDWKELNDEII